MHNMYLRKSKQRWNELTKYVCESMLYSFNQQRSEYLLSSYSQIESVPTTPTYPFQAKSSIISLLY